jgi:hypothetical protein
MKEWTCAATSKNGFEIGLHQGQDHPRGALIGPSNAPSMRPRPWAPARTQRETRRPDPPRTTKRIVPSTGVHSLSRADLPTPINARILTDFRQGE